MYQCINIKIGVNQEKKVNAGKLVSLITLLKSKAKRKGREFVIGLEDDKE